MINRVMSQLRDTGVNPRLELLGRGHDHVRWPHQSFPSGGAAKCGNISANWFSKRVIPRTTRLAEAPSFGKPIIHYDKYSAGAAAYEVLTQEVLKRLKLGLSCLTFVLQEVFEEQ